MARGSHKVNPIAFRIGTNKNWSSRWYSDRKTYGEKIFGDIKCKKLINERLKQAGVGDVIIRRQNSRIYVDINVARPGIVIGRGGEGITKLKQDLTKLLKQVVEVKIFEIKNPETIAKIVAETIAMQCEKRMNPRVAMSKAIEAAKESGIVKGIDIWVGGRIKGAEMARKEKSKWGTVPRHTIRADLDYAFTEANVPGAGKHGIKVWINKGEKNTYNIE